MYICTFVQFAVTKLNISNIRNRIAVYNHVQLTIELTSVTIKYSPHPHSIWICSKYIRPCPTLSPPPLMHTNFPPNKPI